MNSIRNCHPNVMKTTRTSGLPKPASRTAQNRGNLPYGSPWSQAHLRSHLRRDPWCSEVLLSVCVKLVPVWFTPGPTAVVCLITSAVCVALLFYGDPCQLLFLWWSELWVIHTTWYIYSNITWHLELIKGIPWPWEVNQDILFLSRSVLHVKSTSQINYW